MDAKKLGAFIAENRKSKGMTQADLAKKIYVTDKAVSRWERGKGFPDINTIEPLVKALDLDIIEIMKAEKLENRFSNREVMNIMKLTIEIEKENRKQEQTAMGLAI